MIRPDLDSVFATVISCRRSHNVEKVQALCGDVTWIVKDDEVQDYLDAGAAAAVAGGGLCPSRNKAMDLAFAENAWCLELSDDLKKLQIASGTNADDKKAVNCDLAQAVSHMKELMKMTRAYLGGVAPTPNLFYFNPNRPAKTAAFIVGDMILMRPTELRFDENLKLKEDYDYTLQHLKKYGRVARVDTVLATFDHRSNKGGAVDFRTSEKEKEAIAYLREKWPGYIRDNPRRPDEILLKLK